VLTRSLAVSVVAAVCATTLLTASAGAAVFLRTDPSGAVLPAGSLVQTSHPQHIPTFGVGGIQCTTTFFGVTVGSSGGATVTGTVTNWTFQNCTDGVPGLTVTSCSQTSSTTARATFSLTEFHLDQFWLKCSGDGTSNSCYYRALTATGGYVDSGRTSVYFPPFVGGGPGITLTHSIPPGAFDDTGASCGTDGTLRTALTWLTSGTPETRVTIAAS
jgi:hypothetical protein